MFAALKWEHAQRLLLYHSPEISIQKPKFIESCPSFRDTKHQHNTKKRLECVTPITESATGRNTHTHRHQ